MSNYTTFTCLQVTKVNVYPFKPDTTLGHLKGIAVVTLNDQLVLRGLRIMEGDNGMFVAYPTDPFYKGDDYRNMVEPTSTELREHIEKCVLEMYNYTTKEDENG